MPTRRRPIVGRDLRPWAQGRCDGCHRLRWIVCAVTYAEHVQKAEGWSIWRCDGCDVAARQLRLFH